jgi:hypothetical protein
MSFPIMVRVHGVFINALNEPVSGIEVTAKPNRNFRAESPTTPGYILIASTVTAISDSDGSVELNLVNDSSKPIVYEWIVKYNGKSTRLLAHLPPVTDLLLADMLPTNEWDGGYSVVALPTNPSWLSP